MFGPLGFIERIEIGVGNDSAVGSAPARDVNVGDSGGIARLSSSDEDHGDLYCSTMLAAGEVTGGSQLAVGQRSGDPVARWSSGQCDEACHEGGRSVPVSAALGFDVVGEQVAEAVHLLLPNGAMLTNPLFQGIESGGRDAAGAYPADLLGVGEAALFKDLQMLGHGGEGDSQRRGQHGDGQRTFPQPV